MYPRKLGKMCAWFLDRISKSTRGCSCFSAGSSYNVSSSTELAHFVRSKQRNRRQEDALPAHKSLSIPEEWESHVAIGLSGEEGSLRHASQFTQKPDGTKKGTTLAISHKKKRGWSCRPESETARFWYGDPERDLHPKIMEQEFGCDSDGNESLDLFEEEEGDDDLDFSEASGGQGGPRLEATAGLQDTDGNDKTWTENKSIKSTSVSNSTSSCNKPTNPIPNATDDATSTPSPSPPISRIGLNAHKAGMEGLDKTKINQIILEASRGSKFYENEVRKERQATERISRMTAALKGLTSTQKLSALRAADRETERLEAGRDLSRIVVHVDMDAFYAAVETRDEPWLRDVPMAVGGNSMLVSVWFWSHDL